MLGIFYFSLFLSFLFILMFYTFFFMFGDEQAAHRVHFSSSSQISLIFFFLSYSSV